MDYYNNGDVRKRTREEHKEKSLERKYEESCCKQVVVILSSILGVVSLGALIALNVANLAEIYKSKTDSDSLVDIGNQIKSNVIDIKDEINNDLKPKTNLINTMTSFKIPTMITAHSKLLQTDIVRFCSPRYDNPSGNCPITHDPFHSGLFQNYDPSSEEDCVIHDKNVNLNFTGRMLPFASFIPSPTTTQECQRHPSFALSSHLYSYTHSLLKSRCVENSGAYQFWTIGKIVHGQNQDPVFETVSSWLITKYPNRRSCTTAVGQFASWLACTVSQNYRNADLAGSEKKPLTVSYMDVYGRRRDWFYQPNEYVLPNGASAIFFSIGSGVIYNGKVYFLAYGTLSNPVPSNAYCWSPECPAENLNQTVCNDAQKLQAYNGRQMVNFIVNFNDDHRDKPQLTVRIIPPSMYDIGSEGRLLYFERSNTFYIYKKSSSWHALVFFGVIDLLTDLTIRWFPITTFSRPGYPPCQAGTRCPKVCGTGMYTDYFPLLPNGHLGVGIILRDSTFYINPTITIATDSRTLDNFSIMSTTTQSGYTTTTCFKFNNKTWCLGIAEINPGTLGNVQPIAFLFNLGFRCAANPSTAFELGSGETQGEFIPTSSP